MSILQKEMRFPKIVELDLFYNDMDFAQELLMTDLEIDGWITIQEKGKQHDLDSPIITFTEKSAPFLLPRSEMERSIGIQKVRVAEENLDKIIDIQHNIETNSIVIEYTIVYKNITPFASLFDLEEQNKKTRKSHFVFTGGILALLGEN